MLHEYHVSTGVAGPIGAIVRPWLPSSAVVQSCRLLTSLWLGGITGPNGASVHGPIAAAAAPVPTAVVPAVVAFPAFATVATAPAPAPVEFYQTIVKFEGHITRQMHVKTSVTSIPVRGWLSWFSRPS